MDRRNNFFFFFYCMVMDEMAAVDPFVGKSSNGSSSKAMQSGKSPCSDSTRSRMMLSSVTIGSSTTPPPLLDWRLVRERGGVSSCKLNASYAFPFPEFNSECSVAETISCLRSNPQYVEGANSIFRQLSNPVCGSWKSQASSPWAKQHRT